jgi:chemotaxis protein MotB
MWEHESARAAWLLPILAGLVLTGCQAGGGPFAAGRQNTSLKQSMAQLQDQNAELQTRASSLDADNQQLQSMLAQEQQRVAQLEDENSQLRTEAQSGGSRGMGSYAQADASKSWLPVAQVPGAEAYRSGETVHIRLSNANLFDAGSATLKRGAHEVLDRVASAVRQNYPNQLIGIEGHTDGDPIRKSKWKSNHELSVQRALAVYEYLRQSGSIPESQLFVAGYGPNLPIAANSNNQGKAQNRRVELVVRPESAK